MGGKGERGCHVISGYSEKMGGAKFSFSFENKKKFWVQKKRKYISQIKEFLKEKMENVKTFNKKFSSPVSMVYTAEMLLFSFFFYFLSSLFFARKSRNGTTYRIGQLTDPVPEGRRSIWIPFVVCVCFSLFCFFFFSLFFFIRRFF